MDEVVKWMWFADIVGGINVILAILGVIAFGLFCCTIALFNGLDNQQRYRSDDEEKIRLGRAKSKVKRYGIFFFSIFTVLGITVAIMPSQTTMYAVAATKAGDQIINTDLGKKTIQLLNSKIDDMLKSDK